mgnify:CR=1 FL=1
MMTTYSATRYACGHRQLWRTDDSGELIAPSTMIEDDGRACEESRLGCACPDCEGKTRDVILHITANGMTLGRDGSTYEPRIRVHHVPAGAHASAVARALRHVTLWPYGDEETQIGWGWLAGQPMGAILRTTGHGSPEDRTVRYA